MTDPRLQKALEALDDILDELINNDYHNYLKDHFEENWLLGDAFSRFHEQVKQLKEGESND